MRHERSTPASSSATVGAAGFAGAVVSATRRMRASARVLGMSLLLLALGGRVVGALRRLLLRGLPERLPQGGVVDPVRGDPDLLSGVHAVGLDLGHGSHLLG